MWLIRTKQDVKSKKNRVGNGTNQHIRVQTCTYVNKWRQTRTSNFILSFVIKRKYKISTAIGYSKYLYNLYNCRIAFFELEIYIIYTNVYTCRIAFFELEIIFQRNIWGTHCLFTKYIAGEYILRNALKWYYQNEKVTIRECCSTRI